MSSLVWIHILQHVFIHKRVKNTNTKSNARLKHCTVLIEIDPRSSIKISYLEKTASQTQFLIQVALMWIAGVKFRGEHFILSWRNKWKGTNIWLSVNIAKWGRKWPRLYRSSVHLHLSLKYYMNVRNTYKNNTLITLVHNKQISQYTSELTQYRHKWSFTVYVSASVCKTNLFMFSLMFSTFHAAKERFTHTYKYKECFTKKRKSFFSITGSLETKSKVAHTVEAVENNPKAIVDWSGLLYCNTVWFA